jgi:hypothetical protein
LSSSTTASTKKKAPNSQINYCIRRQYIRGSNVIEVE